MIRSRRDDKAHGRIEHRRVDVLREVDWLSGDRRFPGELRLPDVACILRVHAKVELADRCRQDTRYFISSAGLSAAEAAEAVRGHWAIENRLHWVLDVVFRDDQSRLRKGQGARNMAVVRHFALNLLRSANDKKSLKLRRKIAGRSPEYLASPLHDRPGAAGQAAGLTLGGGRLVAGRSRPAAGARRSSERCESRGNEHCAAITRINSRTSPRRA
jgi:predicted transposase YbfD/YdcC